MNLLLLANYLFNAEVLQIELDKDKQYFNWMIWNVCSHKSDLMLLEEGLCGGKYNE